MSMNLVILIGNLGQDAEVRKTPAGKTVMNFSIATHENYKDKSGILVSKTEWHRCTYWTEHAEKIAPRMRKGDQVTVTGKIQTHKFKDKSGADKENVEVKVDRVEFGSRPGVYENDEGVPGDTVL